ncbi:MAG TPA: carboxypeptidase-like regulatory domain-containing protein [Puia sp.]
MLVFLAFEASGQEVTIRGTVFNMYRTHPLEAVSVVSNSGRGTTTDVNGNYSIRVNENDSLSFSYLGRATQFFAVKEMNPTTGFDIALHVNVTELSEVRVAPRNYHLDSLQNRIDYEKSFDYKKPGFALTSPSSGLGVGLDLDALINMFKFKQIRRSLAFRERLIDDEEDKFVDHRFNRSIIKKITQLDGDQLDSFMTAYRPSYQFTKAANDYDFFDYIKLAYSEFEFNLAHPGLIQRENIFKKEDSLRKEKPHK